MAGIFETLLILCMIMFFITLFIVIFFYDCKNAKLYKIKKEEYLKENKLKKLPKDKAIELSKLYGQGLFYNGASMICITTFSSSFILGIMASIANGQMY